MKKRILGLDWKEHLLYSLLLLATGWFFQHKTTEAAQLHSSMEAAFPLAVQTITSRQNSMLMSHIHRAADQYRSDKREIYRARATAIQAWVESADTGLKRIAETPDVDVQRTKLAPLLEQLLHLSDSIRIACDSDSAVGQRLRQIFPDAFWDMTTAYFPRAEQQELARLANALRLRTGVAANAGLRYCFSKVRNYPIQYAYLPVLKTRQPCPSIGELFEAEIYLIGYMMNPAPEVEINGRPVVSDNGLVHFEQRFDRPGRHKIRARFMYPDNEEGAKFNYEHEFQFEVGAR